MEQFQTVLGLNAIKKKILRKESICSYKYLSQICDCQANFSTPVFIKLELRKPILDKSKNKLTEYFDFISKIERLPKSRHYF